MQRILSLLLSLLMIQAVSAQTVRLTEIQPINTTGLLDEDGTPQGWIEIWNASTSSKAVISSYKLVSQDSSGTTLATWTFPSLEIMPDERFVVFASGKNRTVATSPVHTDFTLLPAGGTLQLQRSTGTVASQLDYPPVPADASFGRDEADININPTLVGIYENPTPGERNNYSGSGVAGKVIFDQPDGTFTGTHMVTLTMDPPVPGAEIRYTLATTASTATAANSLPKATSTLYTGPISLTATTMIRARVFKTGLLPGETESRAYLALNATTATFTSSMPLMVLTNFAGSTPPDAGDQSSFLWVWEPTGPDNLARFTDPPVLSCRTVIDRRGSSTLGNPKHNLNVELRKNRDEDERDEKLLGMPSHSDWVFGAPYDFDRSDLHNPLAYAMSNAIGRYASRTRQAEVFIDTNGGQLNYTGTTSSASDYFGIYNITEKIRRGSDRVDIKKLDTYDNDDVTRTGGWIWKIDRLDSGDSGFSAGGQSFAYYTPKEVQVKSPQRDPQEKFLTSYINSFNTALQGANSTNPELGYAAWLDVPAAIEHHLINVWTFNVDALRLSGYWTKERGGKMFPGPVWDFDRTLSSTDGRDSNPAVWRSASGDLGTDFFNYPWWTKLFKDPDFYQKYIDRWVEIRRGPLSRASLDGIIDALNAEISAQAVSRDLSRWARAKRSWNSPFVTNPDTGTSVFPASQAAEVQRLKDYTQQRANFFDSQWVGTVGLSVAEGRVTPGTEVILTGPAGATIYYTLDGSDPRPSGGAAPTAPAVLMYSGPLTINATTRLTARAYNAAWTARTGANNPPLVSKWSGLTQAVYSIEKAAAAGDFALTEIHYHPAPPTAGELAVNPIWQDNDFEFLELRNITGEAVSLGGAAFTDGVGFAFTGQNVLTVPAGGYVVIASNPAAFAARYPAVTGVLGPWSGNLNNGGETVELSAADASVILSVTYDDDWLPETDGPGNSMVVLDPLAAAGIQSMAANWRASSAVGGSPGTGQPNLAPGIALASPLSGIVTGTSLPATALDDGLPAPAALAVSWSKISGPGTVAFADSTMATTTATFSLPGTYVLRLTANDGALTGSADVTVHAQDTTATWLARHPGIGTLTDDFDGDGYSNLTEFALNTDPANAADVPVLTVARDEAGRLTVSWTGLRSPANLTYQIEVSDGLGNFATTADFVFTDSAADGVLSQSLWAYTKPLSAASRFFVRLKITVQ